MMILEIELTTDQHIVMEALAVPENNHVRAVFINAHDEQFTTYRTLHFAGWINLHLVEDDTYKVWLTTAGMTLMQWKPE